ncbi:MAG: hypothetical protein E6R03_10545 [Hyphomicrobiaceae bacterium]|nr:MAG: hypothetical protein E6R03_10545 [Hyphomicrobiaceae bacterium]
MERQGCRIGRVKFKSGGELHLLPRRDVGECSNAPEALSGIIDEETLAVGFFMVRQDRTTACGWSHDSGVTMNDMLGGVERLRADILEVF